MSEMDAGSKGGLAWLWVSVLDALDRARARWHRHALWRQAWLVSWERRAAADHEPWVARLSCPELPVTIARRGRSRCHALRRARIALDRLRSTTE